MKFNYEFSDLEKAKRVAANLSLPKDIGRISRTNSLEGLLILFANWQEESFGDWNGDKSPNREGECEADNDAYEVSQAVNSFLYDMGLFDSEIKTWKDVEEHGESWQFNDKIELFKKYFKISEYSHLKDELKLYDPCTGDIYKELLTEEYIKQLQLLVEE